MCGIIAAASTRNVGKLLVQGLHKMEYRGYDSAGIALHQNESIAHLRALGKVQLLEDKMVAEIQKGVLVLVGIEAADTQEDIDWLVTKITQLRIFGSPTPALPEGEGAENG